MVAVLDEEEADAETDDNGKFDASIRYRFETVDDDRLAEDASASTVRTRLGYRWGADEGFQFRVQGEHVAHLYKDLDLRKNY